jgi:hypothetical protein
MYSVHSIKKNILQRCLCSELLELDLFLFSGDFGCVATVWGKTKLSSLRVLDFLTFYFLNQISKLFALEEYHLGRLWSLYAKCRYASAFVTVTKCVSRRGKHRFVLPHLWCTLSSKMEKMCRNSNSLYTTIVWPSVLLCDTSYTRNSMNQKCVFKKWSSLNIGLSICKILRQWTSLPIILSSITLDFKTWLEE